MQDSEAIRKELLNLIINFEKELQSDDLREKVLSLIPCFHQLRDLGKSLISKETAKSARDRILYYFKKYPYTIIGGDELLVVSGIQEYTRRVRELKVQYGWSIVSGVTAGQMTNEDEFPIDNIDISVMGPSDYILIGTVQDREAAHRWNIANVIRRENISVRDKILKFFRENVGKTITGEELRYVAKDRTEWARRVRELRTEFGWPIVTKNTGKPDLDIGVYLLEADRQSPEHDRHIPDRIKREVLRRDRYKCQKCGWSHEEWNRSDPRHLELHHIEHHAKGGENIAANLSTLCIICHDEIHSKKC
jgi:hypothetical protein